jgi:hypothetical protein
LDSGGNPFTVIAAVVSVDRTRGADTPPWWSELTTEDVEKSLLMFRRPHVRPYCSFLSSSYGREKDTSDDVIIIFA